MFNVRSGKFKLSAQGSDLAPFVGNATKVKIPSEIKLPLKQRNCLKLLEHPDAVIATTAITDHGMFLEFSGGIS